MNMTFDERMAAGVKAFLTGGEEDPCKNAEYMAANAGETLYPEEVPMHYSLGYRHARERSKGKTSPSQNEKLEEVLELFPMTPTECWRKAARDFCMEMARIDDGLPPMDEAPVWYSQMMRADEFMRKLRWER